MVNLVVGRSGVAVRVVRMMIVIAIISVTAIHVLIPNVIAEVLPAIMDTLTVEDTTANTAGAAQTATAMISDSVIKVKTSTRQ